MCCRDGTGFMWAKGNLEKIFPSSSLDRQSLRKSGITRKSYGKTSLKLGRCPQHYSRSKKHSFFRNQEAFEHGKFIMCRRNKFQEISSRLRWKLRRMLSPIMFGSLRNHDRRQSKSHLSVNSFEQLKEDENWVLKMHVL